MDREYKKGFLEICILKSLVKEDSYGYQIIKAILPYVEVSESTLYPILKRLEKNECLTTYTEEYNGRLRKYYQITEAGHEKLKEFKELWPELNKMFKYILGGKKKWVRKSF